MGLLARYTLLQGSFFFFFFPRFFYNQNTWKATWTLQTKVREIVDRIMASLNEAIEKEGLKKKKKRESQR